MLVSLTDSDSASVVYWLQNWYTCLSADRVRCRPSLTTMNRRRERERETNRPVEWAEDERIRYNFKVNCIFCNHLMCITCPIGENKKSLIICLIQHIGARADTHLKRWRRLNFSKLPTLMDISGSGFIHECALCSRRKRSALRSCIYSNQKRVRCLD